MNEKVKTNRDLRKEKYAEVAAEHEGRELPGRNLVVRTFVSHAGIKSWLEKKS